MPSVEEFNILVNCAKRNGVALMEAMRPTMNPNFKIIKDKLPRIGDIRQFMLNIVNTRQDDDLLKAGEVTNDFL